jgi:hypothetical protein
MPTVVEGPQVQPDLIPAGDSAVFLDPTPEWQREVLMPRPMPSSDPARALRMRLIKDRIYADRIVGRARDLGFPVLVNDGTRSLIADAEAVLRIPAGMSDVRDARRWENEVVAANIRGWLASPEAPRERPRPTWSCECGDPTCDATLSMSLEEYETGSVRTAH